MKQIVNLLIIILLFFSPLMKCSAQNQENFSKEKEDGNLPPFKYPCNTSFNEIGYFIKSKTIKEIYIEAKHYDFGNKACMFSLNEYLHNIVPDQGIIEQKVYILDTIAINPIKDKNLLIDLIFKKKVMAVYTYYVNTGTTKFDFDPFEFGYYKKPKGK